MKIRLYLCVDENKKPSYFRFYTKMKTRLDLFAWMKIRNLIYIATL
ncbi:hypothetical protein [Wolbachia endosymbiont of Ctenocephalides felis wCfeJ]|nr:hypothetical protein [Wolbachia endosymbiont of Ctenocephalides felis wCfeJ]